jgi:hypothetical protein
MKRNPTMVCKDGDKLLDKYYLNPNLYNPTKKGGVFFLILGGGFYYD